MFAGRLRIALSIVCIFGLPAGVFPVGLAGINSNQSKDSASQEQQIEEARKLNEEIVRLYRNGKYDEAIPLAKQALEIAEKALGPKYLDTAISLGNLALLYTTKGDYAKAEPLYLRAVWVIEKLLGPEHPDTATALSDLAGLYRTKGDYAKAEPLYERALEVLEKALGLEHPRTALLLSNLAGFYYAKSDFSKAIAFLSRTLQSIEKDLHRNLVAGSERQVVAYLNQVSYPKDIAIALHLQRVPDSPAARDLALASLIQFKGRSLDAITDSLAALRRKASPADRVLFDNLGSARALLSATTHRGPGNLDPVQYRANLKALEDEVEKIEADLSKRSAGFREQIAPVTIAAVKEKIPLGISLVEFALYLPLDPTAKAGEPDYGKPRYVAYVLTREGDAQWAELGEARMINKAIAEWRTALRNPNTSDKGRGPKITGSGEVKQLAREVDRLVMQPVRKLIGNSRHLLISPDGALNLIPFAALVDEKNRYLIESLQVTYLTTARDLIRLAARSPERESVLLVGNPAFNDDSSALPAGPAENRRSSDYRSLSYASLPGAEEEVALVQKTLPGARSLIGKQATEAALKQVSGPRILHIATHGFFLEDQNREAQRYEFARVDEIKPLNIENPMLRSGLALAGANLKSSGQEDGLLTALEVAGLDLYGTKLVTLSACDTGIGEVKTSDGVYGLRRALVLAGSETQMMSLWPVSDRGTRDLMIEYYKALQAGEGRSAALRNVQLRMIASRDRLHPYYWASFMLSGEWASLNDRR
jgi:CHAT domain-containing protein/tetratricopeptide (TPR) repeat protein